MQHLPRSIGAFCFSGYKFSHSKVHQKIRYALLEHIVRNMSGRYAALNDMQPVRDAGAAPRRVFYHQRDLDESRDIAIFRPALPGCSPVPVNRELDLGAVRGRVRLKLHQ
jgi:hypothetical protein